MTAAHECACLRASSQRALMPDDKAVAQDNDEFWMYDELKTRVADPQALRNKFVNGSATMRDKDSDKMIASRIAQASALCSALSFLVDEVFMATLYSGRIGDLADPVQLWPSVRSKLADCFAIPAQHVSSFIHSSALEDAAFPHVACMLWGQQHVHGLAADLQLRRAQLSHCFA